MEVVKAMGVGLRVVSTWVKLIYQLRSSVWHQIIFIFYSDVENMYYDLTTFLLVCAYTCAHEMQCTECYLSWARCKCNYKLEMCCLFSFLYLLSFPSTVFTSLCCPSCFPHSTHLSSPLLSSFILPHSSPIPFSLSPPGKWRNLFNIDDEFCGRFSWLLFVVYGQKKICLKIFL